MTAPVIDWRTLPAGRELDAVVAERVLGRAVTWLPTALSDRVPHYIDSLEPSGYRPVPAFSTDMAAAWPVLTSRPVSVWSPSLIMQDDGAWWCGLKLGYNTSYTRDCGQRAETAPLAIVRAALAATEARP